MTHRKKTILIIACVLVIVVIGYVAAVSLNAYREMMKMNTGSLWHLPTRIYSAPLDLVPGMDISRSGLVGRLVHLGYRTSRAVDSPGQYKVLKDVVVIYLHAFEYTQGEQKARKIRIMLEGNRVRSIIQEKTGKGIASARLEPECIATVYDAGFEDREIIKRKHCPDLLVDALLCIEDRRFYEHSGFDVRSMIRALMADIFHAQVVEGGSTITQQLVKNLFLSQERTLSRKIKEIWLSSIMEMVFTKDEILTMYMNEIYLGRFGPAGIYGFGRASRLFFDKGVSELTLNEAALLVGLIRAPNIYSPYAHPKAAIARRNTVLATMKGCGRITQEQYEKALGKPLGVVTFITPAKKAPYFIDHVLSSARALYPDEDFLAKGGLRIFTTLDMNLQRTLDEVVKGSDASLARNIQIASVLLDPSSGSIKAMTGGRDYGASQFNRATSATRNIGSLIKPIVYYTALKGGYTLSSILDDSPVAVRLENRSNWAPVNYDNASHGNVMLVDALANSYNQATVRLGLALGLESIMPEAGAVLPRAKLLKQPSLLLGAVGCSPLDVAGMYAVFANGGMSIAPWCLDSVVDEHGVVLWKAEHDQARKVLEPGPTFLLNAALKDTMRRGTARAARTYGVPDGISGKTGTTNDLKDSWFAGYTKDLVVVVWCGDDGYRPIGLTGAAGAMPIAAKVLARVALSSPSAIPEDIVYCDVDPRNGKKATTWTEAPISVPFLKGTEPKETSEEGMPGLWKALKHIFPLGE